MKGDAELIALIVAADADDKAQAELGEVIGRLRARQDRAIRDMEAANLLPRGAEVACIRQGCHKSTLYRRVSRFQKVARQKHDATKG